MFPSRTLPRHGVFLQRQAAFLAAQGIECTFMVPRPWAPWPLTCCARWQDYGPGNALLGSEFACHEIRYPRPPGQWFRRFEARAMQGALVRLSSRLHSQQSFDAILACPMVPDASAACAVKEHLSLPLVTLSIGSDILVYPQQMPVLEKTLRQTLRQTDLAVGVSQAICTRLEQLGAVSPLCVYLGRDSRLFAPPHDKWALRQKLGWADDAVVGLYVGNMAESKGMIELAEASQRLLKQHPHFHLVCAGAGGASDRLAALQPCERVTLLGELAPQAIPTYLQAADYFVFPSHSEGMPQAVLEAMECGLPILATRVGGIPEAVTDGDNGLLVDARQVEPLHEAMERLITDKAFRYSAGQRSLAIVKERFDSTVNAMKLVEALRGLVNS